MTTKKPTLEELQKQLDEANANNAELQKANEELFDKTQELEKANSDLSARKTAAGDEPAPEREVKVVFLRNKTVFDAAGDPVEGQVFKKGETYTLKESSANHFINRGIAVEEGQAVKNAESQPVDDDLKKAIEAVNLYLDDGKQLGELAKEDEVKSAFESLTAEQQEKVEEALA